MTIRPPILQVASVGELYAHFARPLDAYRPIPWWAWTGDMNEAEMRAQLDDMKAKGVLEFFLFPIYGLEIPYMSAEYWERVRFCLAECRARGMKCWIYDEYNWPSGVCAGRVLRDHPEFAARTLYVLARRLAPGESVPVPVPPDQVEGAYALDGSGCRTELRPEPAAEGSCVVNRGHAEQIICAFWHRPTPTAHVYQNGCTWNARVDGYTDLLNPDAVRAFLESTYAAYRERFGEFYPDVVPGYFTDEPGMAFSGPMAGAEGLPYTPGLFEAFQAEYGYNLRECLHRMVLPEGDYRAVRRDLWRWCAHRFGKAFTRQLADWCEEHGVALTGHFLGEEFVTFHVSRSGDLFEAAAPMHIPGIDLLENAEGFTYDFASPFYRGSTLQQVHLVVKWLHGIVRHAGRREMMSEAFGVCDWGLNPSRQRKGTNYQAALGVTLFNDNSLIYGISDFRKTAIGGKHFTVPWWQHYGTYSDYCARVAGMHAEGRPSARIGVLYPRSSLWSESDAAFACRYLLSDPEHRHPAIRIQEALAALCDALIRRHHPFDIVPEPIVERAEVGSGVLQTPAEGYRALILPCARVLPAAVIERALTLAETGGLVILVGDLPEETTARSEGETALARLLELARAGSAGPARGGVLSLGHPPEIEGFEEALDTLLRCAVPPPVSLNGPGSREFVTSRRLYGDDALTFVANMSDAEQELEVSVRSGRNIEVWHPDRGERYRPNVDQGEEGPRFWWQFSPGESVFVVDAAARGPESLPALPPHRLPVRKERRLDGNWDLALEPGNLLRLELDLRRDPENIGWRDGWHRDDGGSGWETSQQRRVAEPIDLRDTAWYWLRARVHVQPGVLPPPRRQHPHAAQWWYRPQRPPVRLVVDDRHTLECYVNGVEAAGLGRQTIWDSENRAFEIGPLLREGDNLITLRVRTSPYQDARVTSFPMTMNLIQPVALVGRFTVASAERPQAIAPAAYAARVDRSLHLTGHPHFAGCAIYTKHVVLVDVEGPITLDFPGTRDSVEVWINGQQVDVRAWPPYTAEVSRFLKVGMNDIELRVRTTMGNFLKDTYAGFTHDEPFPTGIWSPPVLRWRVPTSG